MSEALNDAITSSSSSAAQRVEGQRRLSATIEASSSSSKIPDETRMGPPTLRVKDLHKMLSFYEGAFGLRKHSIKKDGGIEVVELSVINGKDQGRSHDPLLILIHDPDAKDTPRDFAGLFHYAVLVPDRKSLAEAFLWLQRNRIHFDGFADHLVSESLYLHDPEGNGIEIYRDKPRNEWTRDQDGRILMDTLPLDLAGILGELSNKEGKAVVVNQERNAQQKTFPIGTRIGHMHLRVTNLERSAEFYTRVLGFHVSADWSAMGAMFLAANGYHHHLGLNTWHSSNGKQHERGEAGLDAFTVEIPRDSGFTKELHSRLEDRALLTELSVNETLIYDPDRIPIIVKSV